MWFGTYSTFNQQKFTGNKFKNFKSTIVESLMISEAWRYSKNGQMTDESSILSIPWLLGGFGSSWHGNNFYSPWTQWGQSLFEIAFKFLETLRFQKLFANFYYSIEWKNLVKLMRHRNLNAATERFWLHCVGIKCHWPEGMRVEVSYK